MNGSIHEWEMDRPDSAITSFPDQKRVRIDPPDRRRMEEAVPAVAPPPGRKV